MTERVICFPKVASAINGWPTVVRLSNAEAIATEKAFLGGLEALRTPDYRCACRTVGSLTQKGILDRNGLTALGRAVGESLARPEL